MEHENILVLGGTGLVGSYLLPLISSEYPSLHVSYHFTKPIVGKAVPIDLTSHDLTRKYLERVCPSIIVNLAAFTDVDGCELDKARAVQLNSQLPRLVSDYVISSRRKGINCYYLHVSTDYVFDGKEGHYTEDSEPNPINWYGKTKLNGEREIINSLGDEEWCIARISTPFGSHPTKQSFPVYIINKLKKGETVNAITDQFTSPTYALDLARMFSDIIKRRISQTIHVASRSRLSRYQQGTIVARTFKLDPNSILKSKSRFMNWKAARPFDSSLEVTRASKLLRSKPRIYNDSIKDFAFEYLKKDNS